jgi:GTP-binding protein
MALANRSFSIEDIRNIAIIAHVDHGKTTLVDGMLKQTHAYRQNQTMGERVLDSNDLERERGITILAKNTGIDYKGVTINIVDTPGHADFGGEVERIMNMVDGALLLVDAVEGPMAQTRFVLRQALAKGLKVILVVNKIDRPAARPDHAVNATFDLFIDLGATEEQVQFPVIYAKATDGRAGPTPAELGPDLTLLFDTILDTIPAPLVDPDGPTQLLITALEYSSYVGKIAVGRLHAGRLKAGQAVAHIDHHGNTAQGRVTKLYTFRDLQRQEQTEVSAGTIVAVAGIPGVGIGDTLADPLNPVALPPIKVEEPTVRMVFRINDSPFAGREGKYVTSRQLRERLMRELESNVPCASRRWSGRASSSSRAAASCTWPSSSRRCGARGTSSPSAARRSSSTTATRAQGAVRAGLRRGAQRLLGRGGRDAGQAARPHARHPLWRRRHGLRRVQRAHPRHPRLSPAVPDGHARHGRLPRPVRRLLPYAGDIEHSELGSLVSLEAGPVSGYALEHLTARGTFFVRPPQEVYAGQVVGEHIRDEDLVINVCRTKNLTGHRAKPTSIVEALLRAAHPVAGRGDRVPARGRTARSDARSAAHSQDGTAPRSASA